MKKTKLIALLAIVLLIVGSITAVISFAAITDSSFIATPEKTLVQGVDYEYSFAVLGDTQCISIADAKKGTAYTKQIFEWIKNNKEGKNIQYVLGLGDITDTYKSSGANYDYEWNLAKESYAILEGAGIPYSLVRGNHDISSGMNSTFGKGTEYYNSVIALSETTDAEGRPMGGFLREYTDETKSAYKVENSYRKIIAGEDKWIIVTLDWAPSEEALVWLSGILETNPDYRAIVTLHQFVQKDGAIIDDPEGTLPHENIGDANWGEVPTGGTIHPRELWDRVLRKYANVEMIISGHVPVDDIVRTQYRGDNGNTVTCMLIDPQEMDEVLSTPVGMVAMFYFSADGSVVHVEYISTVRDTEGKTAYRGANNQFSLPLEYADGWVKTEYGYVPKPDYDNATFLTFLDDDGDESTDSVYLGAYNEWVDAAGSGGVQPMVRTQFTYGGATIRQKKTLSVLMMKDYDGTSDGKYQYIGDVCGTLRLDLNGKTFTNGKYPMLAAYTRTTYNTNTFEVVNGAVKLTSAGIFAIQTGSGGNGGVINAKLADLNISYAEGGTASTPIVTTYPGTSGKISSAKLELTDCNIDAYNNAPSTVTLFKLSGDSSNNSATVTVKGGSITLGSATGIYSGNADDKLIFDESASGYTKLALPVATATAPAQVFENGKGDKVVFGESSRDDSFVTYAIEGYNVGAGSLGVIEVWLIGGQSNASGYAIDIPADALTDNRFINGFDNVLYYGSADDNVVSAFTPVKIGQGKSVSASGAEIGIAAALAGNGKMNAVIKLGRGASYLYPDTGNTVSQNYGTWTSPSYIAANGISTSGNKIGQLYHDFLTTVENGLAQLEAAGYTPVIRGMWWMQGEAETGTEARALSYEALLTAFISDVRGDLSKISGDDLSDMPFVLGLIRANEEKDEAGNFVYAQPAYMDVVVNAQKTVVDKTPFTAFVETDGLVRRDRWHFIADAQQYLGEKFVENAVILAGKYSVTVNGASVAITGGGAYEAGATVTVTITAENGYVIDKLTFTAGSSDPVEITLAEDGSYTFTMPEANVVFNAVTYDPGMIDTVYGMIPSQYADVYKYPFAVFRNGSFYNAYANWNDVLKAGASILTAETPDAILLLRRDYSTDEDTASLQDLYTHEGNLTIDLGGHTLTRGAYHLFQVMSKKESAKVRPTNIKVINGTIQTKNSCPIAINSRDGALADHFYFEFNGVTFKYASNSTFGNMIMVTYTNGTVDTAVTAVFKNCTFDLTNAPSCTLFGLAEESGNAKTANVTIENSTFVTSKLSGISLYNAVGNDKFVLGEGVRFALPTDYDVTGVVYTDTTGNSYGLVSESTADGNAVYTLAEVDTASVTTKYGVIPSEYSSASTYPFVVFDQNGNFFAAYEKWDTFLAAGSKILTSSNKKATLLLRRDYGTSENGSSSQNWYTFSGSILIDLDGNTITIDAKSHLFQFINKCTKDTTTDVTIMDGTIVTYKNYTPFIINGHTSSTADYTVNLTCNGVTFEYHQSSTVKKLLLDTFTGGTTASNFNALFNDCVFDISQAPHAVNLFNAKESTGTVKAANITINGGTLKAPKFSSITFAALGTSDTLAFGKNASGKYLTLSMPEGQTATTTNAYNGADGEELYFNATGNSGEYVLGIKTCDHDYTAVVTAPTCTAGGYTTYTCSKCGDSYVGDETAATDHVFDSDTDADCNVCGTVREVGVSTAYGTIPSEWADATAYPFVLFVKGNGTAVYASATWKDIVTKADGTYLNADDDSVILLVRTDASEASADLNLANIRGKLLVDLDGNTISVVKHLFKANKNTAYNTNIEIKNGNISLTGSGFLVYFGSGATTSNKAQGYGYNLTFSNVNIGYASGATATTIVKCMASAGKLVTVGNLRFEGCVLDFRTNAPAKDIIFLDASGDSNTHSANIVIDGGKIIYPTTSFTLVKLKASTTAPDSFKFSNAANGKYTTIVAGSAPTDKFDTEEGKQGSFVATDVAGEYILATTCSHNYNAVVTAPTCTEGGYTTYTCTACGYTYVADETDALGHAYDDEYDADCNNCGEIREVEIPVTVVANGTCGVNTTWVLTSDGVLTISGNGDTEDYLVSITTEQPYRAYEAQITKVVFEEGVTSIGRGAFYGFTAIEEVILPESLIAIHEYAFFGCTGITSISIPENTFYIGMYAFRKSGLASISFANAEGWTFANGTALGVTNVKAFTTENTYKQTCMRPVSEAGEIISNGVFGNKDQFTWTLTSTGVLTVSGKGNMPKFNVNTTPWYGYRGAIRSVIIEEGITSVGRCSFHTCRAITNITLPESLETIAEYAFYNCQFLTEATIPASVTRIEVFAFRKCKKLTSVEFAINYGWSANGEKISATEINFNAADMLTLVSYTKIWTRDVNAEEEVLDPNYVTGGACNTTIKWALTYTDETKTSMKLTVSGTGAMPIFQTAGTPWYQYLDSIVEIEVGEGITEIGRCAFYGLKFVRKVTLHEGLVTIGDYAFNTCRLLKEIEIPSTVTAIGLDAFAKTGLSEIPTV